jgi:glutathione S-transferase
VARPEAHAVNAAVTVHGFSPSGNCHKVRLLLEQLGRPYTWIEIRSDIGATRTPEFLAINPNAKVPVLVRENGDVLTESNAMLCWLADGTDLMPADPWARAQALSWMFFEQYSHEPYVAVARFICGWTPIDNPRRAELPRLRERAHAALAVMERHLATHAWFTGERYGIADIALFAYTAVADEGGVSLEAYPAISAWLERVRATPRFVALPENDPEVRARLAAST